MGVGVAGADEGGEVALVGGGEDGEEGQQQRDGEAELVGREGAGPEGREQVRRVPAGRDGVLHGVGLAGVGGGEVARVAGEGAVADEVADAGALAAVVVRAAADAGVVGFDGGGEAVGLGVL